MPLPRDVGQSRSNLWVVVWLLSLGLSGCVGPMYVFDIYPWELQFEIRIPKDIDANEITVHQIYPYKLSAGGLMLCGSRNDGSENVWICSAPLYDDNPLRYIAFEFRDGRPAVVFEITGELETVESPWSNWLAPDFLELSRDPDFHLMRKNTPETRVYELPDTTISIRNRVRQSPGLEISRTRPTVAGQQS